MLTNTKLVKGRKLLLLNEYLGAIINIWAGLFIVGKYSDVQIAHATINTLFKNNTKKHWESLRFMDTTEKGEITECYEFFRDTGTN